MSTVHHQEYLNTVYTQQVFVMLVLLASAVTTLADAYRTSMTNTYCMYSVDTPDDRQWTCQKHVEYFTK